MFENVDIGPQQDNSEQKLISQPKHECCRFSKNLSHWDGSFQQQNHRFELMGKKITTILRSKKFPYLDLWLMTEH